MHQQLPDFEADAASQARSSVSDSALAMHVERVHAIDREIANYNAAIKNLKDEKEHLLRDKIVRIMDELRQSKTTLVDGQIVSVADFLEVSIPSESRINDASDDEREELIERRQVCLDWLDANGLGSIVANQIIIDAGKGDNIRNLVKTFVKENNLTMTEARKVHPATLKKAIRELNEKEAILPPEEPFALARGRTAKISPPKKSTRK